MDPSKNRIMSAALLFLFVLDLKLFASLRPETSNRLHLDRFVCTILQPQTVKSARCVSKHISQSDLRLDLALNFSRPLQNIWLHAVFYYKFNGIVYSKFPIDIWENLCEFIDGKRENTFFLNWWVARLLRFSNVNHSCPYSYISVKKNNVSLEKFFSFRESILPSGRYRIEVSVTEDDRVPLLDMIMYEHVLWWIALSFDSILFEKLSSK